MYLIFKIVVLKIQNGCRIITKVQFEKSTVKHDYFKNYIN